jgi:hypothetical protein
MFVPQSASVAQGAAWQLLVAGVVVTTGVHSVPPSLAKQGAVVATLPSSWQLRPLAQSASVVQVWARPRPGAMRVVAITIVPRMSLADAMVFSF